MFEPVLFGVTSYRVELCCVWHRDVAVHGAFYGNVLSGNDTTATQSVLAFRTDSWSQSRIIVTATYVRFGVVTACDVCIPLSVPLPRLF